MTVWRCWTKNPLEKPHSSSCIDHVSANMHHEVSTLKCTISDHYALLVITDLERHLEANTPRKYRDFKCLMNETTAYKLLFLLNHRLWKAFENLGTFSLEIIARILDFCNIYCPDKTVTRNRKSQSWETLDLKKQFRKRDKLHLFLINNSTEEKKN